MQLFKKSEDSGAKAESAAAKYLQKKGLKFIEKNYRVKGGEIDLIMKQDDVLVFVEVKFRKKTEYGLPAESVTRTKQQRIILAAHQYIQSKFSHSPPSCRFDVVAVRGIPFEFEWISGAFEV